MKIIALSLLVCAMLVPLKVFSQQATEAKIYQNYPLGMNMLQFSIGTQTTNSTIDGDITLPNKDIDVAATIMYLRYATFFKLFNKTAGVQVVLPYVDINADFFGTKANNSGLGDMIFVLGSNIIGGEPLSFGEYLQTPRKTVFAWSFATTAPTGSFSSEKLLNPSGNRWQFKPELAVSIPVNKFDIEVYAAAKFFTTNKKLPSTVLGLPASSVSQRPFYSLTLHNVYNINDKIWVSFDAAARTGGETSKNGMSQNDAQTVLGLGGSMNYSPTVHHKIGLSYVTNAAGDENSPNGSIYALKYSYVFGGGIDKTLKELKNK